MSWGNYPVLLNSVMTDVRTLLQREREARRIQHPHLSYSKSGALTCLVCSLNVKSEALWEGHLKSANHRKNLRDAATNTAATGNGKKRKIEEVTEEDNPRKRKPVDEESDGEGRKKRQVSFQKSTEPPPPETNASVDSVTEASNGVQSTVLPGFVRSEITIPQATPTSVAAATPPAQDAINEDEWAAFSAEIAPLTTTPPPQKQPSYTDATIIAAPISASELAAAQAADANATRRSRRDEEAEEEKEEEAQRLADEFDVMEEMEGRVRRLKEKREALRRRPAGDVTDVGQSQTEEGKEEEKPPEGDAEEEDEDSEGDDGDEGDDWFS